MSHEYINEITLLYVEDDEMIREVLVRRLERKVKKLIVACNGEEGLELFNSEQPDMILTDVTMPIMNGIEMSKAIRTSNHEIPIIIVSAHGDSKYLLEAIDCGVTSYLLKPIDKNKLYMMLEEQAKTICLKKVNEEQQRQIERQNSMLQHILDAQKSISMVTDFKAVLFANKAFLDYFNVDSADTFSKTYESVLDIFQPMEEYINKKVIDNYVTLNPQALGKAFYDFVEQTDETQRLVLMLDKALTPGSFYLSISKIEDKGIYLITLTDITKMTIEKVHTQKKAYTDKLTGLYNRNKLVEFFEMEAQRSKRYNHALCIAILDIDHFKSFNDTHGHLIGDEVLIMIANSLSDNIRNTDFVARWGGEEFVIIFVETQLDNAINSAQMLRSKIESLHHKTAGKVTASFGVTQYKDNETLESLFERADKALYQAKENGRNQVVAFE